MNFKKKLREICTYHSDDGTSGYMLSEEQFSQIQSLIKDVIGEAIPYNARSIKKHLLTQFGITQDKESKKI